MLNLIIVSLTGLVALVYSFGKKGTLQRIVTAALCCAILLVQADFDQSKYYGLLLIGLSAIYSAIYGLLYPKLALIDRGMMIFPPLLITLYLIFKISHWPNTFELKMSLVLGIILFILYLFKHRQKLTNEFGFILIWFVLSILFFVY